MHISVIKLYIFLWIHILHLEGRLKYVGENICNMFSFPMLISMHPVVGSLIHYIVFWVVHSYWWFDKRCLQLQWNIWLNNVLFSFFLSFFCFFLKSSTFKLCTWLCMTSLWDLMDWWKENTSSVTILLCLVYFFEILNWMLASRWFPGHSKQLAGSKNIHLLLCCKVSCKVWYYSKYTERSVTLPYGNH